MTTTRAAFVPVDQAARERARTDLDTSLVIEAGAGTGKTTLIIDRIEALVLGGRATLDQIAAVTFTENAAATMKLRLRERLERRRTDPAQSAIARERAAAALDILERAPISTIHALCAAMLQERPLECSVIPGFRMADEAEIDLLFGAAWDEWLSTRLMEGDDIVLAAVDAGIALEAESWAERSSLRGLARRLVEERDLEPLVGAVSGGPDIRVQLLALGKKAQALCAQAEAADTLRARLHAFGGFATVVQEVDEAELAQHLEGFAPLDVRGNKEKWASAEALEQGRVLREEINSAIASWQAGRSAAFHARIVAALLGVVSLYQKKKRARGALDFLDLLVLARDALRDRESLRRYFRARFPYLIIDEFQDTDPLQGEIAALLAGDRPGALVVVGDAKQSIYRFRRADVDLFRRISKEYEAAPRRAVLHLTQNFRSRPAILSFANRVFAELIQASDAAGQPAYEAIEPPPGLDPSPSVMALGFEGAFSSGEDLLRLEAPATAAFIGRAAAGGFTVRDPATGTSRGSRAGDVMVLASRLTQLRHLEEAMDAAGLRFTVEGGKSFFDRWEVHETLSVLRAIDDPSDRVALVAALRSSFFGVSDRDLAAYVLEGGYLGGKVDVEKQGAAALGPAMAALGALHERRRELTVARLLDELYDETRVLAALTGAKRGEAQIANLEKVAALARGAAALGVLTLRGFIAFLQERIRTAREEPDLPATRPGDPDTVRVLTIHRAKGLEAPIVVLYDCAADSQRRSDAIPLWDQHKIAIGFRRNCQPPGWDQLAKADGARAAAESRRLLYVACTRARDLLMIPAPRGARPGDFLKDLIAHLPQRGDDVVQVLEAESLFQGPPPQAHPPEPTLVREDALAARWLGERTARLEAGSYRPFAPTAATRLVADTAAASVLEAPRGTGGRDFGRLVHRILERIDFGPGARERAHAMAASLAPSFLLDAAAAGRAAEAVTRALALPVMERARQASAVWRELPLWFPDEGVLVEGVVDLLFVEANGLVVVDYKTDAIVAEQALAQAAHHAAQLQIYGRGLAQATGMEIRERVVLFTSPGIAVTV